MTHIARDDAEAAPDLIVLPGHELARDDQCILPADMNGQEGVLTDAGVTLLAPVADHPKFRLAALPPGWHLTPGPDQHEMALRDDRSRIRALLYCREANGQWRAHLHVTTRYTVSHRRGSANRVIVVVRDGNRTLHTIGPVLLTGLDEQQRARRRRETFSAARAWLAERHPSWLDPRRYWDD
ncbi:hypothetical protein JNJ66_01040 [Candidatus Saccharibacteria bacterium]|nr:hypothetical protein [Candidatus Saccharibacteria bacterium]